MRTTNIHIHQELIDKCKQGNKNAQFEIYKLYSDAMYNTAVRIVNDEYEAEDVMQEAFLQAFNKLDTYKGEVSFGAWLKKIVVNKSLDMVRRNKLDTFNIDENPISIIDDDQSADEKEVNEKVKAIKEAIGNLPEKDRVLLNLYLIEGYDQQEISEFLNISYASVRTAYSRAKKKLQSVLQEMNVEYAS